MIASAAHALWQTKSQHPQEGVSCVTLKSWLISTLKSQAAKTLPSFHASNTVLNPTYL